MAANRDLKLIAKIADVGPTGMRAVIDAGIRIDHLTDSDARMLFDHMLKFYHAVKTGGDIPTREQIEADFPTIDLPAVDRMKMSSTIEDFQKHNASSRLLKLSAYIEDWKDRPDEAIAHIEREVKELGKQRRGSTDIVVSESIESVRYLYEENKNRGVLKGIPYPWKVLNDETRGMQDGEYIIFYGRPKCVVAGQRVMAQDGSLIPIETPPDSVPVTKGHKLTWGPCSGTYAGIKNAVRITTKSGHTIEVGEDHPLMIPNMAFKAAGELSVGAYIGIARKLPSITPAVDSLSTAEATVLGYLIGDGNYTRNEVQFTNEDKDVIGDLYDNVEALGAVLHQPDGCKDIQYRIIGKSTSRNTILDLLKRVGCHGQKGPDKHVPDVLFRSHDTAIKAFLSAYTDTDGTVGKGTVSWCSASYNLIRDVKHLLLRFGITGTISEVETNFGTTAWHLHIFSQEQHAVLHKLLDLKCGHKAKKLQRLAEADIRRKRHDDGIPYSDELMQAILTAKGIKEWKYLWSGFSIGKLFRRTGNISRHLLRRLAEHLDAPELLDWANSDIRWEPILSIEKLGPKDCYDITIEEGEPVFVVEDFITHNSLKTWIALNIGMYAYDYGSRKILIYTREMAPEQMMERCVCLLIGTPYREWKHGLLHTLPHPHGGSMEDHFYSIMETMKQDEVTCSLETGKQKGIVITSDRQDKKYGGGVRGLRNKIDDFKPDLIIADAVYLMRNDRDNGARSMKWGDQASISQDLKELAQDIKRPIVATLQANRASEKEDQQGKSAINMSFSDSYAQDTDLAIEIIKKRVDSSHNELALAITASREANIAGFAIHGDPATNFSQLYRQVYDDCGAKVGADGKPMMMPVVFNDSKDIKEIFWKNYVPEEMPDHNAPTPGKELRNKGPAINISRRGPASGSV